MAVPDVRSILAFASLALVSSCGLLPPPPPIAESSYRGNPNNLATVSGIWEYRVTSDQVGSTDYNVMLQAASNRTRRNCSGEFVMMGYNLYDGSEATSRFLGITRPWFEARFRCSVVEKYPMTGPGGQTVEALSAGMPGAAYFDIYTEVLNAPFDRTFGSVVTVLKDQGNTIGQADSDKGYIITTESRPGIISLESYLTYIIALESLPAGKTRITYKLFSFVADHVPATRDGAYRSAAWFLEAIRKALQRST